MAKSRKKPPKIDLKNLKTHPKSTTSDNDTLKTRPKSTIKFKKNEIKCEQYIPIKDTFVKSTIITRFWSKHVGGRTIKSSYMYICNILAVHMIVTIVLIVWCIALTFLVIK